MLYFRAASNILKARLGAKVPLKDAAVHVEVLEEESVETVPPLAVLPGSLERVTRGVPGHTTAAHHLKMARMAEFRHAPVVHYVLPDCYVHRSGVEYRGGYWGSRGPLRQRFPKAPVAEVHEATFCMAPAAQTYFGHWLRDACPTALLGQDRGRLLLDLRSDWPDAARYATAFGLQAGPFGLLHVDELHVFSDHAQGQSKRARYNLLRTRLAQNPALPHATQRPVYLRRGATGAARRIAREDQLCEVLDAQGFDIIDMETVGFEERYRRLSAASVVVSIEGSHVNHAEFAMPAGSALILMIPGDRFTIVHRGVAHAIGLRFGCLILDPSSDGYVVAPKTIFDTIELVT